MRIKVLESLFLSTVLGLMIFGTVQADVAVHLEGFYNEFYFTFNQPRGSVNSYDESRGIIFFNADPNNTVTISNIAATISDIPGFTVTLETNSIQIEGGKSGNVKAVFHASPDMAEGVHRGRLAVTGTGASFDEPIRVQITWPDPVINASWDVADWGWLVAGTNLTRNLVINESMGYKPLNNVELNLLEFGPVNLSFTKNLDTIAPRSTTTIPVVITVPSRGVVPGRYFVSPSISTNTTASIKVEDSLYDLPSPELRVDPTTLNFNSITFEAGKDSSVREITISETRGYTPVENVNITLVSGETDWIDFQSVDYIPPGTTIPVSFSLRLPPEASLGVKEWKYSLTTKYAGGKEITGSVSVYFPGVEDAIKDLNNIQLTLNVTGQQKELFDNTLLLLEGSRGETELKDITMVMSVYSGTRSLITLLEELNQAKENDLERAGAIVVLANNALNRINIGNDNIDKPQLKKYSEVCSRVAKEIWRTNADSTVQLINERSEVNKDSNYRVAALYYKRGAEIYTLLNDQKAVEYDALSKGMEDLYKESITNAINLRTEGLLDLDKSHGMMVKLLDFYFVLNPFSYDDVLEGYSSTMEKYEEARFLFDVSGEKNDADLISIEVGKIKGEERIFKNAFLAYSLFWIALFIWFLIRVSLGLQYFNQDEEDTHIGEVVLTKERA